jgi:hypothetical protein
MVTRVAAKIRYKRMPHRCISCGHRKTLSRLWSDYIRPPKCEHCGYYRLTPCRDRLAANWGRKHACNCGGYWFKHRKGSRFCYQNPNAEQHYIEREMAA